MTTPFLKAVWTIVRKDLRAEFRTRELFNSMILFSLLSILVFSFALELDRIAREEVVSGVLWVTIVFASFLGLNRSLAGEREQGSMHAMMLAPINRVTIYAGKLVGNFLFTLVIGLLLLPLMTVLYNITLARLEMVGVLALGTLGLTSVGTLLATMTVQTRSRETLLPIAMMPVALPVLIVVVRASSGILQGEVEIGWLATLALIDLIYLVLGALMFEYVIED